MQNGIGKKVANYRRMHDITIKELGEEVGVSPSLISQLERGLGNPTLSVMASLASGMGITLADLVSPQVENMDLICRKEDRIIVRQEDNLILENMLVEDALNTSLTVHMMELQPGASSNQGFESHLEEECLCVVGGEIIIVFAEEEFLLRKGDSIRILPGRLHMVRNDSRDVAAAYSIKCKVQY